MVSLEIPLSFICGGMLVLRIKRWSSICMGQLSKQYYELTMDTSPGVR